MNRSQSFVSSPESQTDPSEKPIVLGAGINFTDPGSPLAPYYLRVSHVLTVAFICLVYVLLNFIPLWHTDIWGHLKHGSWIVQHTTLPETDLYCPFTVPAPETIHYCWLGQAFYYSVFHVGECLASSADGLAGGVEGVRFAHALLVVLRLSILFFAFQRLSRSALLALTGIMFLWALNLGNYGICRPQVLGELCFALILIALSRPLLSRRSLILVPVVMVLWANVHGSYAVGFVMLGGAFLGRLADIAWTERTWRPHRLLADPQSQRLLLCIGCCLMAVDLLNPSGPRIYWNTLRMATHAGVTAMDEWQPLHFRWGSGGHWSYLATVALLLLVLCFSLKRCTPSTVVLILLFGIQPLYHQRALVWWLMLTPWLLMRFATALIEHYPRLGHASVLSFRKTLLAGMCVFAALAWSIPFQWMLNGHPQPLERSLFYGTPWQLARQLQEPDYIWSAKLHDTFARTYPYRRFTGTIFASETLGDYFVWSLGPEPPVFIYTHIHLFSPGHWELCTRVRSGSADWRQILDRFRVNLLVVEAEQNARLCGLLRQDSDWQVILDETGATNKRDPRGRLFVAVRLQPL
jgi:hypothetical protein